VQGVRLGVRGDRPREGCQGETDPGGDPERDPAGQGPDEVDRDTSRDRQAQPGEQVHPEGRVAERLQDHRREPAQQDVGREPGRMGGAQDGRDDLQLTGIPERDPGQHRDPGSDEGDGRDADRSEQADAPHHPGARLQSTPRALTARDTTIRDMAGSMPYLRRRPQRRHAERHGQQPEGRRVVVLCREWSGQLRVRRATLCYAPTRIPRSCRSRRTR
jgi:hypothetical protein